jgi:Bacterial Ig-like domain (group 3)
MYGVSARPRSFCEVATCDALSGDGKPQIASSRPKILDRIAHHRPLLLPSFTLISMLLSIALSGCGGVKTENPQTAQGSGGSGQGGTTVASLSGISCTSASVTGAGKDTCTVTLSAAAPSGGLTANLSSSSPDVTVPATVTVPANATSTIFTATVATVANAESVTLTASAGTVSETFTLLLNATTPTLTLGSSDSPSTYGDPVVFTATISSGPTGTITFFDGSDAISIGTANINGTTATLTTSTLTAGSHLITASWLGNGNYGAVTSAAITQLVNKASPAISWTTPAAITYGTAISAAQLDASSALAGNFTYSPAAGAVLSAGTQTLSATFAPIDSTDYTAATATVALVVNKAAPVIYWSASAPIADGTALTSAELDATSTVAGTFVYAPPAGTVLTPGSHTLTTTFTPSNITDYSTATASVPFTVDPPPATTPVITWIAPAAISYGTALSATQLDATTTVAGAFTYMPAAGTVLSVGSQTLSVKFTPTDLSAYNVASASVPLMVNKATPNITWAAPAAISYGTALSAAQLDASSTVAGSFTYSPAAGTVLSAGTHTLTATFTPTDAGNYSTTTLTVTLTVNPGTDTITWPTPAAITYGTALGAAELDATSTAAGTFTYSPAAGTVLSVGSHTLTATFTPTDSADYSTSTATVMLTVNKAVPAITWGTPAPITYGTALSTTQLDAASSVTGTFAYSPALGTVLSGGTQTLSVTFTPTDSTDYSTATSTVSLTVNKATPPISWATPAVITYGTALSAAQLDASSTVAGSFTYSPAAGTVLAAGSQVLTATFTPTDAADYTTASATVALTVNMAAETITWPTPAAIAYGTALSATQLNATSTVAGTFSYSPAAGTVLTAGTQTLTVTFTPTNTTDYSTATASVDLTVNKATPAITWATPAAISYGTALSAAQLDASSTVAGTYMYSPRAGIVLPAGTHTITATLTPTDSADYNSATATVTLIVNPATATITWPTPAAITYGTALSAAQLDATSAVAGTFAYSPAAGSVLTAGTQTLSVTFTPTNTTDYSTATASVALTVNKATPAVNWATPTAISYGTALSNIQLDATSSTAGTFSYSPAAGAVLSAGNHTLTATFTPTDAVDYNSATVTVTLTVTAATETITWLTPASITYGTTLNATQLDATASIPGTFAYTPAAGTVLTAGTQTLSATFTPTDTTDYSTATASVTLTVNKATPTITWATPAPVASGTPLSATQLDATANVAGTFSYSPAIGTVLSDGSHALTATFTPTDSTDYNQATATVVLTVNSATKTTPTITWATPAAIIYGTALSATQLDATTTVAGTFSYSPAAATVLIAGAHTLTATFTPTDTTNYTTATGTVTLTVNQATPAVTWAAPAAIAYGTALSNAQLDATSTVAGTFTYSPAAGTVLTAGSHTLTATFTPTDTTDYATATATVSLAVGQITPAITWATPAAIAYGTALSNAQLDATSTVAGTFAYSPAAGTVLTAGSHTLTVTFTPTDSTDYKTATATVTQAVNQATPSITWPTPAGIPYGTALSSTQLDATSTVTGTFVYAPAAGIVLAGGTQTLSVTFTPTDSTDYSTATASVSLTVGTVTPTITWATPAPISYGTALSATQLDATASVPGTFAYTPAAGTVLTAGLQTLLVTFTPTNTTDYSTVNARVRLVVNAVAPTVTWPTPAAISYGTALSAAQLDATASVPGTFVYSPAAGTVLAAGVQTLSVTFTPTDTTDYSSASASVALSVNKVTPAITWPSPAAIAYGTALSATQLDATASVPGTFAYSPAAGTVLAAGSQTLSVTFTPTNTTDYNTVTANVTLTVNIASPTITWATPSAIAYGTALSAAQLNATASVPGTFAYTPAAGTVLAPGSQTLSVTFTPTNTTDYSTATATVVITVNTAAPTITWATPAAIAYGTALSAAQLDATASVAGTFAYTPAAGTVLAPGSQTLFVTFTPTNTTDYSTTTATVTLTVNTAAPVITWAAPAAIAYGTALSAAQLDATASVAGTFAYTPAAGTVLAPGLQTLSVTFTPTNTTDYSTATATVSLTVGKATPTITWATPAAIAYGTALSATQLDATASVPGTFSYSPAIGTVLTTGSQTLSVTFTPTNTTDYSTATASVALTVNKATPTITWATPAPILSGTALGSTQLDATASVPGTFVYYPASGTVPAVGSQTLSVTFTPTDTTDYNTATDSVMLTVNSGTSILSINATSIAFGDVALNTPTTQTVTLTSSGTGSVTVNSVTLTGIGFTLSGPTFPETLTNGQTATVSIEFDPTILGAAAGVLTVVSTSSSIPTATIAVTGTGTATAYVVDLSWDAPTDSTDPVAGYNIYRAVSGSSTYTLVNPSVDSLTTYTDSSVQNGTVYNYEVESVDASGVASVPTSPISVTIP